MGRKIKPVYFSKEKDRSLLEYIQQLPNFSDWVKQQIRRELESQKTGIDPELKSVIEHLLEAKLAGRVVLAEAQEEKVKKKEIDVASDLEQFF
jgi:hypothetical protein